MSTIKEQLLQALEMSMQPNDAAIHSGRQVLEAAKIHPGFLKEMVLILAEANVGGSNSVQGGSEDSCSMRRQRAGPQPLRE